MTKNAPGSEDLESAHAEVVDRAVDAIVAGNLAKAESMLMRVIANTPANYTNSFESNGTLTIKFWDQSEFIHYVTWLQERGKADKSINWIGNAYPRAHYYMGFLCVKRKQFDRAIEFLDKGRRLEPTNPKFIFEKAQALVHAGRKEEALRLFDQVQETSEYVSAHDLAVARRGRGFVLIEQGDLDNAEAAFRTSLDLEPGNKVAINELQYIEHLRQGGAATQVEAVSSESPNMSTCAVCDKPFDEGVVISVKGMPVSICKRCERKLTKKWWQFWK